MDFIQSDYYAVKVAQMGVKKAIKVGVALHATRPGFFSTIIFLILAEAHG